MDPITSIVTALLEGFVVATKETTKEVVKNGFQRFYSWVKDRFADNEDMLDTLTFVKKKPDEDRIKLLNKELEESGAAQDPEFLKQAEEFLEFLKRHGILSATFNKVDVRDNGVGLVGDKNVIGSHGSVGIGGNVGGDVNVNNVTNITSPPEPDWEMGYLNTLIAHCDPLDLSPIDETRSQSSDAAESIRISDVFTTLYLEGVTRYSDQSIAEALAPQKDSELPLLRAKEREKEPLPIQALEAIEALPRLVILGKPGGGKTTLGNHLAAQLAYQRCDKTADFKKLPGWTDKTPTLPVRIILRRFAAWMPADVSQGNCGQVWNYLEHRFDEWGCKEAFAPLKQQLFEKGGVIIFDGLDEVRQTDAETKRTVIKEAIAQFSTSLSKCKIIVTCREYAYQKGDAWRLPEADFPEVKLALFAPEQIKAFTQTWYRTVGPMKGWGEDKCQTEADHLNAAIEMLPHLRELAPYPLLLTLMAQVHGRDGNLPEDRADLYEKATNLLLSHWENRIVRDLEGNRKIEPGLVMQLRVRAETLRAALERAAFDAHERQEKEPSRGEQCADIPKEDLRDLLKIELGSWDKAETVIDYIQRRAGLLQAEDHRIYRFPHRTFQEYLAATHILKQGEFDSLLKDRICRDLNWWREVFLLAAGASRLTPRNISDMVDSLLPEKPQGKIITPDHAAQAQLAAQALHETDFLEHVRKQGGRYARVFECVQSWLLAAMIADESLAPKDRAESGNALNWFGDPRPGVGLITETGLPDIEFCLVPKGPFWSWGKQGYEREKPAHFNGCLNYDYWIARYPVTVNQFIAFVEKSGYQPRGKECLKGLGNNPIVQVSWHDAQAFSRWLTEVWRADDGETARLPEGYAMSLPSEAEWEKAARGGIEIPEQPIIGFPEQSNTSFPLKKNTNPKREYPWGDDPERDKAEPNKANYNDSGIDNVSPVGCFPSGVGAYGCLDISGNVYEWCTTKYNCALCGGAFNFSRSALSHPYHGGFLPLSRNDLHHYLGFRVVFAPEKLTDL